MYLDQPGLMGLWDRMKAVFAPKSHTHQASDVSGIVADVRINGTSITADGVANIPTAAQNGGAYGVVKMGGNSNGLRINSIGEIAIVDANDSVISKRSGGSYPITTQHFDYAVKAAMCDGVGAAWTATEQAAARVRMGVDAAIDAKADIASPAFSGNPTAPTPTFGDSSNSLATTEFVAAAITEASAPTDYIMAQGKCDFWTWRMWKSGVAECWGSTGETYENITSEWGYIYEGSAHSNGFPGNTSESSALAFSVKLNGVTYTKLFKNVPEFCSCSFNPTGGAGISGIEIGGGLSALSTPTVYLLRPTSASVEGHYSYHAKGRWK